MFKRINRLISLPKNIKDIYYNFFPNSSALSIYGQIIPKKIEHSNILIPSKDKWEIRDFNINKNNNNNRTFKRYKTKSTTYNKKIPYEKQWEVRDFYVSNKNMDKYNSNKNRGYDLVILNDKTITYQDYIQQLFLLDKKNSSK